MKIRSDICWLAALGCCLVTTTGCSSHAAETTAGGPATVAEAAKVLSLATFPLADGAEPPQRRGVASLSYDAPGEVTKVFENQRKQLVAQQWEELPGSYVTDQSASGTFRRNGFTLSLMVFPAGKSGTVKITLLNHGNVELAQLPLPAGAKLLFAGPASAMFVTEAPPEATVAACQKLLAEKGWLPYGTAGSTHFFKQNAVRLTANIASAPAQGGKTVISFSSELMSADLPAPADTIRLQYSDSPTQLSFDTKATIPDVVSFYRTTLSKSGWEATTENSVNTDFKEFMIFRNPQLDMLTLELRTVDNQSRVLLRYQTAAEIAELDRKIKEEAERKKVK